MKDKLINIVLLMQIIVTAIVIIPSDEQYYKNIYTTHMWSSTFNSNACKL